MRETKRTFARNTLRDQLLPILIGEVFHVTTPEAYQAIQRTGVVRHNRDGALPFASPQSATSWGRDQGYVCLFDLRALPDGELEWVLRKYFFLDPFDSEQGPVYLFLRPEAFVSLIPWTEAPPARMVIPHAECWYPGDLSISSLREALAVSIREA